MSNEQSNFRGPIYNDIKQKWPVLSRPKFHRHRPGLEEILRPAMAGPSLWYLVEGAGSKERFHRKNHGDQIHRRWVHVSITSIKNLPEVINITHPNPGATPSMGKWTPHITSHFRFN